MSTGTVEYQEWTETRRRTLRAVLDHLLPWPGSPTDLDAPSTSSAPNRGALSEAVRRTLGSPTFATWVTWVLALLDELDERATDSDSASGPGKPHFAELEEAPRERLLRQLEAGDNPYLTHALRLLLQVGLECRLGDPSRGGNPDGRAWEALGLTRDGVRRRLKPSNGPSTPPVEGIDSDKREAGEEI